MKPTYHAEGESFIIDNYNSAPPFADFFPALAGVTGKPMWVFFTNRGQGISSFGINNKDGAMLEFLPANKAYQATPLLGFRTFVKTGKGDIVEPFSSADLEGRHQSMIIRPYELEIRERFPQLGFEISVVTFGVPAEDCPVLARRVTFKNTGSKALTLQFADGLPRIVPLGMGDYLVKNMSRTIEAFAEVLNVRESVPFFKLKVEPHDKPDIRWLDAGFFSLALSKGALLAPVIDPTVIFGQDTAFQRPIPAFEKIRPAAPQLASNIMPCSFAIGSVTIPAKESRDVTSFFGYAESVETASRYAGRVKSNENYFDAKRDEMRQIYVDLVDQFGFHSNDEILNQYGKVTFLDNVLRGGFPMSFSPNGPMAHVYSRKHGDMERDYNAFQISASYYSQGNGNYRDVNQNRRIDLFVNPKVGTANVEMFFNTLQLDGYNPLVINPTRFLVPKDMLTRMDVSMSDRCKSDYLGLMKQPVLPGQIYEFVKKYADDPLNVNNQFRDVMAGCTPVPMVQFGEGYWIDHWTYSLDHLDQYLAVNPDKKIWLLFEKADFTFHDSDHFVRPRREKYIVTPEGKLRQFNAVVQNNQKQALIGSRTAEANKVRVENGAGAIFATTFFVKLLSLATIKAASLDPYGVGIEMDADRPGWCDAMNGLPGLFGSSSHEMFELKRLVHFLVHDALPISPNKAVDIPSEVYTLIRGVSDGLELDNGKDFRASWDKLASSREEFREKTLMGLSGKTRNVKIIELKTFLTRVAVTLERAAHKAVDPKTGLPTSYFMYDVETGTLGDGWRQYLNKLPWKQNRVAPFLEGAVHAMKVSTPANARKLYQNVRKSDLYDQKVKMYKINAPLRDESWEIGRIRIFSPGWLENESIFLHMHYKYLYEILRSGMPDVFFKEIETGLIPFRDVEEYGRSLFENVSFIASSAFPDPSAHGRGFVARLTGATSEFLTMVYHLAFGASFFKTANGQIQFAPQPSLPKEWFTKDDKPSFPRHSFSLRLFGVPVTYLNPKGKDTYGKGGVKPSEFEWILDGRFYNSEGSELAPEASLALREGRLERLTITLK